MPTDPELPFAESLAERQIREAMERGEFEGLPGAGRPLELGDAYDPGWWVKRWVAREQLTDLRAELRRSIGASRARIAAGVAADGESDRLAALRRRLDEVDRRLARETGATEG